MEEERVPLARLDTLIAEAVAATPLGPGLGPGPIIAGFLAPDSIDLGKAQEIAERIAGSVDVKGKPAVIQVDPSQLSIQAGSDHPIIIGLIAPDIWK